MRVLCYAQHLSGVGHFVRMHALAQGLSEAHDAYLVDGGRPVRHRRGAAEPRRVRLPRLARAAGRLVALGDASSVDAVLAARSRALARAVERIRPDVLLVDHYPFSKWELEPEIGAAIDTARRANPALRTLCSLRDVIRQTRYEQADHVAYEQRVLGALAERFDGILVHADPTFTRLEDHFSRGADLPVPIAYTGFVCAPPPTGARFGAAGGDAVLSCGGGSGALAFVLAAMEALRRLAAERALAGASVSVFPGAFARRAELAAIEAAAQDGPFHIRRFGPDFEPRLQRSVLSVSRAGYNTCTALLRARTPAVVVPDPTMSDQEFRARRLAELGLASCVTGDDPPVAELTAAMRHALASPPPRHGLALDGVSRTRMLIETLADWCPPRSGGRAAQCAAPGHG